MRTLCLRVVLACGVLTLLEACHPVALKPAPAPVAPPPPVLRYEPASWSSLPGWSSDDIGAAWPALLTSCRAPRMAPVWTAFCSAAQGIGATDVTAQRALIE